MAKKLTLKKNQTLLKEFKKLLTQKSDNEEVNSEIIVRLAAILDEALDEEFMDRPIPKSDDTQKQHGYIAKTRASESVREQVKRGVYVLQKGDSQRRDRYP